MYQYVYYIHMYQYVYIYIYIYIDLCVSKGEGNDGSIGTHILHVVEMCLEPLQMGKALKQMARFLVCCSVT